MSRPHEVTVEVDVPLGVEERAAAKAIHNDAPEKFEEYLLDFLRFDYDWLLEGENPPGPD